MGNLHPLKAYRDAQDPPLSQERLADLLGVARTTVARWETGTRKVDQELLLKIAEATGIAPADLRPDLAALLSMNAPAPPLTETAG
jgi:transcriptional regulator with XRE-family HTH domain